MWSEESFNSGLGEGNIKIWFKNKLIAVKFPPWSGIEAGVSALVLRQSESLGVGKYKHDNGFSQNFYCESLFSGSNFCSRRLKTPVPTR